jgi:enamine deaminase RidA (YjgF/YER057c/UK114 family)
LARHAEFGDYIPPSTSVIMERCFSTDTTISSSLVAVVPGAEYEIRKIHPAGVASAPTSGYVPTVVRNEFVFVAEQMAHNPGQGLDLRAHLPEHSAWAGAEIRKQTQFLIRESWRRLEAAGLSLERSLKAQIYLATVADFPDFIDVRTEHFAAIPCAVTVVPTTSFATVGEIIEINLLALTNSAIREKQVVEGRHPRHGFIWAVHQIWRVPAAIGLMAIGDEGQVVGAALSPGFARLAHAGYAQAAAISRYAEALFRAAGTAMVNTLRAQYFVSDVSQFPGIAIAWAARFGAQPHPFICIQSPTAMPAPGAAVIADFWISTAS